MLSKARALSVRSGNLWISHFTAARCLGLRVPRRFQHDLRIHITGLNRSPALAGASDVVFHRSKKYPPELWKFRGAALSPGPRVFLELAETLMVHELVAVGDQLVRQPHPSLESRKRPWCTVEELQRIVRAGRGRIGVSRAREALQLVRVGADSEPETYMRLAIIAAGLREPELQIKLHPRDAYSPTGDAGYRDQKIVLQYEGQHHFTAEQQARDQRRNAAFEAEGWTVILANRVDQQEGFRSLIARLERLLRQHR
ncbi:PDDEXK family nuclease [Nesterenkonia ebinurensis]|uniref:hypothetical protein n=1 Tax=Nesterenkonia ebinurensis TaxID=2608252 RepID=UPI00123D6CC0|nr:hypothetical protein [Nesterenkonia ebinurensis]